MQRQELEWKRREGHGAEEYTLDTNLSADGVDSMLEYLLQWGVFERVQGSFRGGMYNEPYFSPFWTRGIDSVRAHIGPKDGSYRIGLVFNNYYKPMPAWTIERLQKEFIKAIRQIEVDKVWADRERSKAICRAVLRSWGTDAPAGNVSKDIAKFICDRCGGHTTTP